MDYIQVALVREGLSTNFSTKREKAMDRVAGMSMNHGMNFNI